MSSSFPTARFPSLTLAKDEVGSVPASEAHSQAATEISDDMLLSRLAAGDQDALAVLFRRYARLVWSVAERIVRNKAEADDLLQDAFLLIQRRAAMFDSSKGKARSLIVHMTYQLALSRRRYLATRHCQASQEAKERAVNIAGPPGPSYDGSIEAHFGQERFQRALNELSEDQRQTLRLYFFEGYTLGEIAAKLGQKEGNIKHHYYRGLSKLRSFLP